MHGCMERQFLWLVSHFVGDVNEVCLLIGKKVVYLTIDTHPLLAMYRETRTERHAASILTFNVFNLFFFVLFFGLVLPLARRICVMISLWRHKLNEVSFSTPASKVCDYICTHQLTRHLLLMLLVRWNQNFGRHN